MLNKCLTYTFCYCFVCMVHTSVTFAITFFNVINVPSINYASCQFIMGWYSSLHNGSTYHVHAT